MSETWNHLDLFSGIGGFSYACKLAGWNIDRTLYSDVDEFANKVFAKNFPDAIPLGDVRKINGRKLREQYGGNWLLTGGFPCQDISCGNQNAKGLSGARSGLFFEVLRLIHEISPEKILIENVEALRRHGLEFVLRSIAACGYVVEWGLCPARWIGSPQLRNRCWIVAYANQDVWHDTGKQIEKQTDVGDMHQSARPSVWERVRLKGERSCRHWEGGFSAPKLCRLADGIPTGLVQDLANRIEALPIMSKEQMYLENAAYGNAIVPQVAALFLEEMRPNNLVD